MTSIADYVTDELSKDLEWRESELALMRKQLVLAPQNSTQEKALLRANLAIIYAHYEGFCKFALAAYIDALQKLRLKRRDLIWPLAALSLESFQKELTNHNDSKEFFTNFIENFNKHINDTAEYQQIPQIANLWPDLLIEWLTKLNLNCEQVANSHSILESLVNKRNQIAHGKKLMISNRIELDKYANAAQLAMHEVAIGISDALEHKTYKRHCAVQTILAHAT